MAGITLEQAQAQLDSWMAASTAVTRGQAYEIEDGGMRRSLKRADAVEIRQQICFWDDKVKQLTSAAAGGRRRTRYVVPE
jgi:hypothetical protein